MAMLDSPDSQSRRNQHPQDHLDEKQNMHSMNIQNPAGPVEPQTTKLGLKAPGVARIEAISSVLTRTDKVLLFLGVFLIAYAYTLDGTIRFTYQPYATASFNEHSLSATINVIRAVIAAAAQPTSARIADVFGRLELVFVSVIFYVVGTIVEATSNSIQAFAGGAVIYQIGYTCVLLLVEVIVADVTSLRSRLLFSYIPSLPFLINTWVSGNITEAVLKRTTWKWGIGMWAIIYPVCALPLMITLGVVARRARKSGALDGYKTPFQIYGAKGMARELFWQLDLVGGILLVAVFGLILSPLTLAGGETSKWKQAHIIAPLVVGVCCIPFFILWEMKARNPLVPFHLLKDRAIWAALGIGLLLDFAWEMQGDYLYTMLIVAFNFTILGATRVLSLYSFCSVAFGFFLGLVVFRVRRLKWFIVAGVVLFMVAFGLLIRYRGSPSSAGKSGVIGAQVVLGIAGGMFPYPTQASIQAATKHEHLAVITGLYLSLYNVGAAMGYSVSGSMWTQILPKYLREDLRQFGNSTLAPAVYANPFAVVAEYPIGTPIRTGIIRAYQRCQRILCIVGISLCIPIIGFALLLRNPKLGKEQSLPEAEKKDVQ